MLSSSPLVAIRERGVYCDLAISYLPKTDLNIVSSSILSEAEDALSDAELSKSLSSSSSKVRQRAARLTWTGRARMAVAHAAGNQVSVTTHGRDLRLTASSQPSQDDAGTKIDHLSSAFRLHSAALEMVARVATRQEDMSGRQALLQQDPFVSSGKSPEKPPDSGDTISGRSSRDPPLQNRRLGAVQLDAVSVSIVLRKRVSRCCHLVWNISAGIPRLCLRLDCCIYEPRIRKRRSSYH